MVCSEQCTREISSLCIINTTHRDGRDAGETQERTPPFSSSVQCCFSHSNIDTTLSVLLTNSTSTQLQGAKTSIFPVEGYVCWNDMREGDNLSCLPGKKTPPPLKTRRGHASIHKLRCSTVLLVVIKLIHCRTANNP
eukprot:m.132997 g.132997  ORF g.132997 m.132997 type:complete len:137 (-) comp13096_c1_seq5:159-569(-)